MKKALTAGLVLAGVIAVTGSAFAEVKTSVKTSVKTIAVLNDSGIMCAKTQTNRQRPPEPPEGFSGKRPPMMSRDKRPPLPPDGKHPRMSGDKRPPMPPDGRHPRMSDDRRPPEFDRGGRQQGVQPR